MRFISLLFLFWVLSAPTIALSSGTMVQTLEEFDVYNEFDLTEYASDDFNLDDALPSSSFNCEIIIVVIDLGNRYRRTNHRVFGSGRSFGESRRNAFRSYEGFINKHRFWRNRFNHSFRYNNCFSQGG